MTEAVSLHVIISDFDDQFGTDGEAVCGVRLSIAFGPSSRVNKWGPCQVRFRRAERETVSQRLFSQIIRRGGRYKVLSYANKLD